MYYQVQYLCLEIGKRTKKKEHRSVKYIQQMPILFKSSLQQMKINRESQN